MTNHTWTRALLLAALDSGCHNIRIRSVKPTLRLIGVGMVGAITKNMHGYIQEFPIEAVEEVTK
ncbi:hypothetical protein [Corynebacterium glutamicum]|uniref:hypothetical protein n=1 Tax=Corynebacterium glutamicum TaxID=1718 RepID=UPI001B8C7EC5|nr:hypothetical protein [Corynebacterium glutamicum]